MVGSEMAGAQDTIYLCNFRVSVDGEWLCLKELQDVEFSSAPVQFSPTTPSPVIDAPALLARYRNLHKHTRIVTARDPAAVERSNLVNISKLVVKELIETSLKHGRMLDSDHMPLQHFFIVLEHVMRHGLKPKKGLLGPKKELWDILQTVERYTSEATDITASVRDLPVRTHMGRARAWLRLALMQKKLADYVKVLIDHREDLLLEFYEPDALMMSEESIVIMGLLVGLNVIDCNLCVKGEDLDSQQGVIDFSLYLRCSNQPGEPLTEDGDLDNMSTVLDQKNYIEELNRHLNATVTNLQAKVEALTTTNALMKEDLAIAHANMQSLQEENNALKKELRSDGSSDRMDEGVSEPVSRVESHSHVEELRQQLETERRLRQESQKELELQLSLKAEMEVAMKLLEKDIHEKQDTIVSLRRQLDDIKFINLEMYRKLEECENSIKHKTELISKLESKTEAMAETIHNMEDKYRAVEDERLAVEEATKQLSTQIAAQAETSSELEGEIKLEREWRKNLEENVVRDRDRLAEANVELAQLRGVKDELEGSKAEIYKLRQHCREQDQTLEELGAQLSCTKLQLQELREELCIATSRSDAQWASDKAVTHCRCCSKEFNLTRRKHHCRNCGEIFCNSCSDNTMALPSSAKPVRVCDACHIQLVARYSVVQ